MFLIPSIPSRQLVKRHDSYRCEATKKHRKVKIVEHIKSLQAQKLIPAGAGMTLDMWRGWVRSDFDHNMPPPDRKDPASPASQSGTAMSRSVILRAC